LDAITSHTVCTALNADFACMHWLQPFHSVNKFSDSTPIHSVVSHTSTAVTQNSSEWQLYLCG